MHLSLLVLLENRIAERCIVDIEELSQQCVHIRSHSLFSLAIGLVTNHLRESEWLFLYPWLSISGFFYPHLCTKPPFNDKYSFQGFAEQFNWDNTYDNIIDGGLGGGSKLISHYSFIAEPDRFDILPLYTGHYVFGAKLPNAVLKMDGDLVFHITLGEHTLTFTVND